MDDSRIRSRLHYDTRTLRQAYASLGTIASGDSTLTTTRSFATSASALSTTAVGGSCERKAVSAVASAEAVDRMARVAVHGDTAARTVQRSKERGLLPMRARSPDLEGTLRAALARARRVRRRRTELDRIARRLGAAQPIAELLTRIETLSSAIAHASTNNNNANTVEEEEQQEDKK